MYPVSSRKQHYRLGNYSYSNYNACPPFILVPEYRILERFFGNLVSQVKQPFPLYVFVGPEVAGYLAFSQLSH